MKILNLFSGIGGNRTLWGNKHYIEAVENEPKIAATYHVRFPGDRVIVEDAYKYLEDHYSKFDFIWASPPCISHTQLCRWHKNKKLPDFRLYSIITFLKTWYNGFWVVENVIPYYKSIIKPEAKVGRHSIWANFPIKNLPYEGSEIKTGLKLAHGYRDPGAKAQEINDKMNPKFGKYILDSLLKPKQMTII